MNFEVKILWSKDVLYKDHSLLTILNLNFSDDVYMFQSLICIKEYLQFELSFCLTY